MTTADIRAVYDRAQCDLASQALCEAFEIESSTLPTVTPSISSAVPAVRGVALDRDQAQLAIVHVPDRPGMAAQIFGLLADKNISVDTIIQSQRSRIINDIATRDIAFTVAQDDAQIATEVLSELAQDIGCGEITVDTAIAKVSIVGAGMVGNPGVAAQFFSALAAEKINIQMITTSEIKISCVVAEDQGVQALQAVHTAFGLSKASSCF